ncbi:MAG: 5-(carboxyamino)imidazole ribonucleotide synthase [Ignavibacteria bacterium]|nr:5-(carboxyamino)imidazole ribonucleotide synthase [Ignavibacteria bacterium]
MKIGIIGGGQLARMMMEASYKYGYEFVILSNEKNSPAGKLTNSEITGDWNDTECLKQFAEQCDVITLENEFIDYTKLEYLESIGKKVFPSSANIKLIQDKFVQKSTLSALNIPVADFVEVERKDDIKSFAERFSYPVILKSRTMGYDGKGNYKIDSESEIDEAMNTLGKRGKLMCERFIPFDKEIAVQAVRNIKGDFNIYPVVETIQENHICKTVLASRKFFSDLKEKVESTAKSILENLNYVGVMGIEMFLIGNEIIVNELAPRVHNSGHYTIEGCYTSQFENHIRAVSGLKIGDTNLKEDSSVMINILGSIDGKYDLDFLKPLQLKNNSYIHLYGKNENRTGRKMGHITLIGKNLNELVTEGNKLREQIKI